MRRRTANGPTAASSEGGGGLRGSAARVEVPLSACSGDGSVAGRPTHSRLGLFRRFRPRRQQPTAKMSEAAERSDNTKEFQDGVHTTEPPTCQTISALEEECANARQQLLAVREELQLQANNGYLESDASELEATQATLHAHAARLEELQRDHHEFSRQCMGRLQCELDDTLLEAEWLHQRETELADEAEAEACAEAELVSEVDAAWTARPIAESLVEALDVQRMALDDNLQEVHSMERVHSQACSACKESTAMALQHCKAEADEKKTVEELIEALRRAQVEAQKKQDTYWDEAPFLSANPREFEQLQGTLEAGHARVQELEAAIEQGSPMPPPAAALSMDAVRMHPQALPVSPQRSCVVLTSLETENSRLHRRIADLRRCLDKVAAAGVADAAGNGGALADCASGGTARAVKSSCFAELKQQLQADMDILRKLHLTKKRLEQRCRDERSLRSDLERRLAASTTVAKADIAPCGSSTDVTVKK